MFKKLSKKKGFTLMEMMIVVAIIAILIAIIIPTFKGALERANAAADEANLRAYYAEVMANAVLEGKDPVAPKDGNKITVSGVEYTLHGTASFKVENGQLIITPDVNKAQEQEAKTAFMDEEIKKLKIRYQNEKEEITAKYVAEQSAGCYGKKA